jgi:hypothetical protein
VPVRNSFDAADLHTPKRGSSAFLKLAPRRYDSVKCNRFVAGRRKIATGPSPQSPICSPKANLWTRSRFREAMGLNTGPILPT